MYNANFGNRKTTSLYFAPPLPPPRPVRVVEPISPKISMPDTGKITRFDANAPHRNPNPGPKSFGHIGWRRDKDKEKKNKVKDETKPKKRIVPPNKEKTNVSTELSFSISLVPRPRNNNINFPKREMKQNKKMLYLSGQTDQNNSKPISYSSTPASQIIETQRNASEGDSRVLLYGAKSFLFSVPNDWEKNGVILKFDNPRLKALAEIGTNMVTDIRKRYNTASYAYITPYKIFKYFQTVLEAYTEYYELDAFLSLSQHDRSQLNSGLANLRSFAARSTQIEAAKQALGTALIGRALPPEVQKYFRYINQFFSTSELGDGKTSCMKFAFAGFKQVKEDDQRFMFMTDEYIYHIHDITNKLYALSNSSPTTTTDDAISIESPLLSTYPEMMIDELPSMPNRAVYSRTACDIFANAPSIVIKDLDQKGKQVWYSPDPQWAPHDVRNLPVTLFGNPKDRDILINSSYDTSFLDESGYLRVDENTLSVVSPSPLMFNDKITGDNFVTNKGHLFFDPSTDQPVVHQDENILASLQRLDRYSLHKDGDKNYIADAVVKPQQNVILPFGEDLDLDRRNFVYYLTSSLKPQAKFSPSIVH